VNTLLDVVGAVALLGAAGLVPTLVLVGRRWIVLPLSVLGGTVMSAVAATGFLAIGGRLMGWFFVLSVGAALVSGAVLLARSNRGPSAAPRSENPPDATTSGGHDRAARLAGALALVATSVWCLRGLRTPVTGLDARLFWFLRGGWWQWSHAQALANMQHLGADTHAGYPPLISSTVAVGWWIAGNQSDRIGTGLVAVVNVCAAVVAAWALVELGSAMASRLRRAPSPHPVAPGPAGGRPGPPSVRAELPRWLGVAVAVLLLFTFFGLTEPFTTNGYADPLWSVAATGAVAYLFLLPAHPGRFGVATILLAVAGETKSEGTATVVGIIVLLSLLAAVRAWRATRSWSSVVVKLIGGGAAVVAFGLWPIVMRLRHVGADVNTSGPRQAPLWPRTVAVYHAMAPHLHILILAAVVSLAGALVLPAVRRHLLLLTDLWAWVALLIGLLVVVGAYVLGPGNLFFLDLWLETSAHRVSEYPALVAWWIIGAVTVLAAAAPATLLSPTRLPADRAAEPLPVELGAP
jgi:hypothetical protein